MIDPDIAGFVAESEAFYPNLAEPPPIDEQRRSYEAYARAFAVRRPAGVSSEDAALGCPDRTIPLRLYRPRQVSARGVVIYAHGGGFMLGSLDSHDGIVARVADEVGVPVIAIDYRLAPEHNAEAALGDVMDVATALLDGRTLWPDLPRERLGLMGDSAGGTLACMAALRLGQVAKDRLHALALIYPMLGFEPAEPARTRWAKAPMLTLDEIRFFRSIAFDARDEMALALPLDEADIAGLPPTVLLPAQVDPLCDDCTVLAERLKGTGTEAVLLPGTGLVHGALRALDRAPVMAVAFSRMCSQISAWLDA